jgi:hypothetical protein
MEMKKSVVMGAAMAAVMAAVMVAWAEEKDKIGGYNEPENN